MKARDDVAAMPVELEPTSASLVELSAAVPVELPVPVLAEEVVLVFEAVASVSGRPEFDAAVDGPPLVGPDVTPPPLESLLSAGPGVPLGWKQPPRLKHTAARKRRHTVRESSRSSRP